MALMDPPNNKSEDVTEDSAGISLEEDGNVEQETKKKRSKVWPQKPELKNY